MSPSAASAANLFSWETPVPLCPVVAPPLPPSPPNVTTAQNSARNAAETHAQTSTSSGSITFLRKKQRPPTQPARRRGGQPQESLPGRSAATESAPNSSRAASGWLAGLTWCLADTELGPPSSALALILYSQNKPDKSWSAPSQNFQWVSHSSAPPTPKGWPHILVWAEKKV